MTKHKSSSIHDTRKDNEKTLTKQIDHIVLRQQELQKHIANLESNIQNLHHIIALEKQQPKPNFGRIKDCYTSVTKTIELIGKIYDTYRAFEDVKFKYHKQISESNFRYVHLIEVDIRRIEEKMMSETDSGGFMEVLNVLMEGFKKNSEDKNGLIKKSEEDLLTDPSYTL